MDLIEIVFKNKKSETSQSELTSIPSCDNNNLASSTFPDLHAICNAASLIIKRN